MFGPLAKLILAAAVVASALPAVARANIIAALEVPAGGARTDLDLALYDATTATRLSLPAGVDTSDDELHPSITPDGRLLTFERSNPQGGTVRIIITDRSTGQSADLFSGFETSQLPPATPAITPDGKTVITGRPGPAGQAFEQTLTLTDVSSFHGTSTGPFPHSQLQVVQNGEGQGRTLEPSAGINGLLAYEPRVPQLASGIQLGKIGTQGGCFIVDPQGELSQPACHGERELHGHDQARASGRSDPPGRHLGRRARRGHRRMRLLPGRAPGNRQQRRRRVAAGVDPGRRYVGFVRHTSDGHSRMFIWDSLTQLMVNNSGIDLGVLSPREIDLTVAQGNLTLEVAPVLQLTSISFNSGLVKAQLLTAAGIGILVQRVVGHQRLLGRRMPRLKLVGRVPLGHFLVRAQADPLGPQGGRNSKLKPGLYQITVRALAPNGRIEDLGRPSLVRVPEAVAPSARARGACCGYPRSRQSIFDSRLRPAARLQTRRAGRPKSMAGNHSRRPGARMLRMGGRGRVTPDHNRQATDAARP